MTRVLVTGGSGYLGGLVLQALADRVDHLVSVDVREPATPRDDVVHVTADLRTLDLADLLAAHRVDAVVHLAAIVDPPAGLSERALHDIEVGGTRRVLEACVAAGVDHLTVTSSGAAYGYHPANRGRWLTEDDPVRGSDAFAYARHKAEVERLLADHRRAHPQLSQLVLRPGTILGARTDNQITALFEQRVVLGLARTEVPFVFAWDRDVAAVVARGVTERVTGTYNVAGDGVLTLADIARIEGRPLVRVPPRLVARVLRVLSGLQLVPYGPEHVDFLRYRPVLANDRLRRAFPGLPTRTTREAYEAYRRGRAARRGEGAPVALVTGAAGGIGTALVHAFAAAGYATVGTDLGEDPPSALSDVVDRWCRADVTVAADMRAAVGTATEAFGRLDVLVANAGVTALGTFDDTDDATFARVMDVNLHGAVRSTRAALPALRATGGRLVAMASVAGFAPVLGRPAYVASKHAVTGLFESLRHELAPQGVGVTVVHPSFLATAPTDVNRRGGPGDGGAARSTTGGLLDADDVAAAVVEAVRRRHDRVFPGRTARLAHLAHRLAPRGYARAMVRRLRGG